MTDRPAFAISDDTIAALREAQRAEAAGDDALLRRQCKEALDLLARDCIRHLLERAIGQLMQVSNLKTAPSVGGQ
jgi:hypothetical protein